MDPQDLPPQMLERWRVFEDVVGPVLTEEVGAQAPVDTGQLAASQSWDDQEGVLRVISTDNRGPIATYVIRGTRAHPIDPVNARMLHWVDAGGGDVFAGHVDHPGTVANPFQIRAWENQVNWVVGQFGQIVGVGYALAYLNPWRNKVI